MLIKFTMNNVVITNTYSHKDVTENTTAKIESVLLEEEVKPEEVKGVITAVTDVITAEKRKNTNTSKQGKRYHVTKYQIDGIWECQKYHQYIIIKDKKNNITKIIFLFENGDSLTRTLDDTHYKMYNKQKYIISEYDSDVIEL